jgi:hypothetical protein
VVGDGWLIAAMQPVASTGAANSRARPASRISALNARHRNMLGKRASWVEGFSMAVLLILAPASFNLEHNRSIVLRGPVLNDRKSGCISRDAIFEKS